MTGSLAKGDVLKIPIAHGEGNYFASKEVLEKLNESDQILFRYCEENGEVTPGSKPQWSRSKYCWYLQ